MQIPQALPATDDAVGRSATPPIAFAQFDGTGEHQDRYRTAITAACRRAEPDYLPSLIARAEPSPAEAARGIWNRAAVCHR